MPIQIFLVVFGGGVERSEAEGAVIKSRVMNWHKTTLEIITHGKGLHDVTERVGARLREWGVQEGMCFLFLPHTSASLVLSENWDPTARADLETFLERLVPEREKWYTHDLEGPDDATSHIRAMLTDTSLTIPVDDGALSLGSWQGIYLFEHRARPHRRKLLIRALSVT
jgi:secondary thiamine-phosphate synthase enzyme